LLDEGRSEIFSLKEKLMSKDEVIEALSNTLSKKMDDTIYLE
jgi:hypothetical protein